MELDKLDQLEELIDHESTAIKMLWSGYDLEFIAEHFGVQIEEVQDWIRKHPKITRSSCGNKT